MACEQANKARKPGVKKSQAGAISPPIVAPPPPPMPESLARALVHAHDRKRLALAEVRQLRARIEELMISGADVREIHRVLSTPDPKNGMTEFPGLTVAKVKKHHELITKVWVEDRLRSETPEGVQAARQAALKRLHDVRRWAMSAKDYKSALNAEKQIAQLEGTNAAKKIDVSGGIQGAMAHVLVGMDDERIAEMLEEGRREEELANHARALLAPTSFEEVHGPAPVRGG